MKPIVMSDEAGWRSRPSSPKIALGAVDGDDGSGPAVEIGVFLSRMIDLAMVGELFADLSVLRAFVGHQVRFASDVGANDRREIVLFDARDME